MNKRTLCLSALCFLLPLRTFAKNKQHEKIMKSLSDLTSAAYHAYSVRQCQDFYAYGSPEYNKFEPELDQALNEYKKIRVNTKKLFRTIKNKDARDQFLKTFNLISDIPWAKQDKFSEALQEIETLGMYLDID